MKQLLVLSGKGGTGKTTVATALIQLFEAKVFADCDVDAPNLHLMMHDKMLSDQRAFLGIDKAEIAPTLCNACGICQTHCRFDAIQQNPITKKYEVNPFACEGCGVCQYLCPVDAVTMVDSKVGTLFLYNGKSVFSTAQLKMGSGNSGLLVTEVKKRMKNAANPQENIAIIDGSPGIGCPVIASISGIDLVLIVTEPSLSGISDLKRIIETAAGLEATLAVCINQWDVNKENTANIETYCRERAIPFVGKIPYDPAVVEAVNQGKSIVEVDCMAGDAVMDIHKNINQLLFIKRKDENTMKIAVAADGNHVSGHFGHCEAFQLFETVEGKISRTETLPNPGHKPGFLPNYLHEKGINVIISGGMGGGAVDLFNENDIEVVTGAAGDAKEVVERYLLGALSSTGSVCHEHAHHDSCGQ